MCLEQRNSFTMNAGDSVIRALCLPAGTEHRRERHCRSTAFVKRANAFGSSRLALRAGLRLIQIQISVGYVGGRLAEVSRGDVAGRECRLLRASYGGHRALAHPCVHHRIGHHHGRAHIGNPASLYSHSVCLCGIACSVRGCSVLGICFHLGINWSIMVGFFSWVMIASYLSFVPPETATRWVLAVRDRAGRLRRSTPPGGAPRP